MTLKEITNETDIEKGAKIRHIKSNISHLIDGKLPNGTYILQPQGKDYGTTATIVFVTRKTLVECFRLEE